MPDDKTQLTIKIDPKIHWLASLCAWEQGMTLAQFVESLIARGITREAMLSNEPKVTEPTHPAAFWHGDWWSEDEPTRLFNVATMRPDWLSRSEQKLWTTYCSEMICKKSKPSIQSFRKFWQKAKGKK